MTRPVLRATADRRRLQPIVEYLRDGVILLEPDGTIGWANRAALDMHGVDELAALGRNLREYRARFRLRYRNHRRLEAGQYPLERLAAGESFDDVVVEVASVATPKRRWVHRVRGLALTDRAGRPDGLVLIAADVTDWAEAEQRFEKTFQANPAPALICRLEDLRYIKVNHGFLDMTGYAREQVLGRSLHDLDVFEQADRRELALESLEAGETIPQMEAELRLPDGGAKLVIVAGQPIELGDAACMLLTFVDLEPRRQAEQALRQSEERFAKAFRMTPVATLLCSAARLRVMDVNEAFVASLGYAAEEVRDRPLDDLDLFVDRHAGARLGERLRRNGSVRSDACQVKKKDGGVLDCLLSVETVGIQHEVCRLLVLFDVTERRRSEGELMAAIEEVMKDATWFSRSLVEKLAHVRHGRPAELAAAELAGLTARERDALSLICEGLADKEIAARLGLAPNTVRNHVAALYSKLDVHSRSEAIVWARERGLFGRLGRSTLPGRRVRRR